MLKLFSNPYNADLLKAYLVEIILNKEKAERAVVPLQLFYLQKVVSLKRMTTIENVNKMATIKLSTTSSHNFN